MQIIQIVRTAKSACEARDDVTRLLQIISVLGPIVTREQLEKYMYDIYIDKRLPKKSRMLFLRTNHIIELARADGYITINVISVTKTNNLVSKL